MRAAVFAASSGSFASASHESLQFAGIDPIQITRFVVPAVLDERRFGFAECPHSRLCFSSTSMSPCDPIPCESSRRFVMNTRAFEDYQAGRLGSIPAARLLGSTKVGRPISRRPIVPNGQCLYGRTTGFFAPQ